MFRLLSRFWGVLVVRGTVAVLLAAILLIWPSVTLPAAIILFGAYAYVQGTILILHAVSGWDYRPWLLFVEGISGLALGVLTYEARSEAQRGAESWLLVCFAAWGFACGALDIVAGIKLRTKLKREVCLASSGAASVLFAVLLVAVRIWQVPMAIWLMATYGIVIGALLIALGVKLRRVARQFKSRKFMAGTASQLPL